MGAPPPVGIDGVGPQARALYAALATTGGDLEAARAGLAGSVDVAGALAELRALRLIRDTAPGGGSYELVSPAEAAEDVLAARESAAHAVLADGARLRAALRDLEPDHRRAVRATPSTEIVRGGEAINRRIAELTQRAERSLTTAHPSMAPPEILAESLPHEAALLARGVRLRDLYSHSARRHAPSLSYIRSLVDLGAEVRTAALIPSRMILVDDDVALVPVTGGETAAAVVHDRAVNVFLREIFDFLWGRGQPVADHQETPIGEESEEAILRELAAGRTDEAIARRLGISTRTLRRQLAAMLEAHGVSSRFQLGMVAVRQGILDAEGD